MVPAQYQQPTVFAVPQRVQRPWVEAEGRILSSVGVIIVFLGVISFAIDVAVYVTFTNIGTGAWWAAAAAIIAGLFGILAREQRQLLCGSLTACVVAIFLGFVGTLVDGVNSNLIVGTYKICGRVVEGSLTEMYGDTSLSWALSDRCNFSDHKDFCVCTDPSSNNVCDEYLGAPSMCDKILTTYKHNLAAAAAFDSFCCIGTFVLSLLFCAFYCRVPPPQPQQGGATQAGVVDLGQGIAIVEATPPVIQLGVYSPHQQGEGTSAAAAVYGRPDIVPLFPIDPNMKIASAEYVPQPGGGGGGAVYVHTIVVDPNQQQQQQHQLQPQQQQLNPYGGGTYAAAPGYGYGYGYSPQYPPQQQQQQQLQQPHNVPYGAPQGQNDTRPDARTDASTTMQL